MQLRLRTKLTLVMTGLVLLVVAVLSGVFFWQLLEQVLRETTKRTVDLATDSFVQVDRALADASSHGWRPESNSAEDIRDYVRYALQASEGLQAQLKAAIGSPAIYEVSVIDQNGIVLISSDKSQEGKIHLRHNPLSELVERGFLHQVTVLRGSPRIFEYSSPFKAGGQPFDIRVAMSTRLLLDEISPSLRKSGTIVLVAVVISTLLAAVVSRATLAPLRDIAAQLDRTPAGQFLGRRVTEIFPLGHPLHEALHVESDELGEVAAETELLTSEGPKRVSVSVQAIQEDGERMGALVTLRDLDSLESINTQLQVSERLAALGRITAGVAHEVKNPLNSMRLWLENLKESLPAERDSASQ